MPWRCGRAGTPLARLKRFRRSSRERPDLTVAYDRLAFMLRASGRVGEAVAVLDEAARAGHADRPLLRSLGTMLRDAGDLRRSAAVLEPLVRDDESDLQAADALGQTYARMGRGAQAEAMFRRVLRASPNSAATWNNLGALYPHREPCGRCGRGAVARGRDQSRSRQLPTTASAWRTRGRGRSDRAVAEWRKALELRPDLDRRTREPRTFKRR